MKKCIVMPDSFKGTLSAVEYCDIAKQKIMERFPACNVIALPVADGGEGTVDSFLYGMDSKKIEVKVHNSYMEEIDVYYARIANVAIIEMAQASGLPQIEGRENPAKTTTFGVGEMMLHAIHDGCNEIILGLGGSATNDAGCGAAVAMGAKFYDDKGNEFIPVGDSLNKIVEMNFDELKNNMKNCKLTAMCDIDNPMHGENGAAYVFAKQKGADDNLISLLNDNLIYIGNKMEESTKRKIVNLSGTGAAGGFGAGVIAFFDGNLQSGIETVLDLFQFEKLCKDADFIFTGEGRIDSQSLRGKVVIGIAKRAKKMHVPVIAIVGSIGEGATGAYDLGVTSIFSINRKAEDFSISRNHTKENLADTLESVLRILT